MSKIKEDEGNVAKYKPSNYIHTLENCIEVVSKYGPWRIIQTVLIFTFVSWIMFLTFNPGYLINTYNQWAEQKHAKEIEYRLKVEPQVREILRTVLIQNHASRAFLMELHNGSKNLTGLPFYYGDIKLEETLSTVERVDEGYQNLSLSRFPFFTKCYEDTVWEGSIEDMRKIDDRFASRLESEDVKYIVFYVVHGITAPIGFLGVVFTNDNTEAINYDELRKNCYIAIPKISNLMDMSSQR